MQPQSQLHHPEVTLVTILVHLFKALFPRAAITADMVVFACFCLQTVSCQLGNNFQSDFTPIWYLAYVMAASVFLGVPVVSVSVINEVLISTVLSSLSISLADSASATAGPQVTADKCSQKVLKVITVRAPLEVRAQLGGVHSLLPPSSCTELRVKACVASASVHQISSPAPRKP